MADDSRELDFVTRKYLTKANARYTRLFDSFLMRFSAISMTRRMWELGMDKATIEYRDDARQLLELMKPGGKLEDILIDAHSYFEEGMDKNFVHMASTTARKSASLMNNAGCLVFGHSIFDRVVTESIRICHVADPNCLLKYINDKKIKLSSVLSDDPVDIKDDLSKHYIEELNRESIEKRLNKLFCICSPHAGHKAQPSYEFSMDRIRDIDSLRQDCIHGVIPELSDTDISDTLDYLFLTFGFIVWMLHLKYDLKNLSGIPGWESVDF